MICRRTHQVVLFIVALAAIARMATAQSAMTIDDAPVKYSVPERNSELAPSASPAATSTLSYPVQQAAFVGTTVAQWPPPTTPSTGLPSPQYQPTIIPPAGTAPIYPPPAMPDGILEPSPSEAWCEPSDEPCRTSSWTAAIEFLPSQTFLTNDEFGEWDDNSAFGFRAVLGYEDPEGLGLRGRFWGIGQEVEADLDDVKLSLSSGSFDLYKRLYFDRTEIAFGGGPAGGSVEFELSDESHSRFSGGGATIFVEGYYRLREFERSEYGAIYRARYSLFMGDWKDNTGGAIVSETNNDTMSVAELAWGLEYRHRFGQCDDHHWFAGVLWEYQRWQSDWMASEASTPIGVSSLNVYTGIAW
jgi:hypothetical protein